jgi:hypothetical protein
MALTLSNQPPLRLLGFMLFLLSFIPGFPAFITVPRLLWDSFVEHDIFRDWHSFAVYGSLSLGWLSNFTVFSSLPLAVAVVAIAAPWILMLAMVFYGNTTGPDLHWLGYVPFYPWAIGINMIHCSRLYERQLHRVVELSPDQES